MAHQYILPSKMPPKNYLLEAFFVLSAAILTFLRVLHFSTKVICRHRNRGFVNRSCETIEHSDTSFSRYVWRISDSIVQRSSLSTDFREWLKEVECENSRFLRVDRLGRECYNDHKFKSLLPGPNLAGKMPRRGNGGPTSRGLISDDIREGCTLLCHPARQLTP